MKTKFKDLLLYSLATIGVVALFISATQTQGSHETCTSIPESHVWEIDNTRTAFLFNKVTGEVKQLSSNSIDKEGMYITMFEEGERKQGEY